MVTICFEQGRRNTSSRHRLAPRHGGIKSGVSTIPASHPIRPPALPPSPRLRRSRKLRRAPSFAPPCCRIKSVVCLSWRAIRSSIGAKDGGGGGIRTPGELAPTSDFKSGALNHSATPPETGYKFDSRPRLSSFLRVPAAPGPPMARRVGGCSPGRKHFSAVKLARVLPPWLSSGGPHNLRIRASHRTLNLRIRRITPDSTSVSPAIKW